MSDPKNILITGASSGIGKALALEYAKKTVTLFLTGRNKQRLEKTVQSCKKRGAKVVSKIIDVKDKKQMQSWINQIADKHSLDLVIANAGISAGTSGGSESEEQINEIFNTNFNGVINTVNPAIAIMQKQQKGQIALMSSLAGFRGLPSAPAYSSSKAAVRIYGEGLRGSLSKENIKVNVICPGYVKTPMTDVNNFPMPFIINAEKAAKIIKKGLENNKSRIAFPFPLYFIIWIMALLSPKLTDPLFARLPAKSSMDKK